jgi:hypothetical protein
MSYRYTKTTAIFASRKERRSAYHRKGTPIPTACSCANIESDEILVNRLLCDVVGSHEPSGNRTDGKGCVMEAKPIKPAPLSAPIFDYLRRYKFKKVVLCNDTVIGLWYVL